MALKLLGSHSSKATICATGEGAVNWMEVPCAIARVAPKSNMALNGNFIRHIIMRSPFREFHLTIGDQVVES
jgi:hypothetical protein